MDHKAVADAMDYIIERLETSNRLSLTPNDGDEDQVDDILNMIAASAAIGEAMGAATAVKLQCEQAGKPKTRGAEE